LQVQNPPISSRLTVTDRSTSDQLSAFRYESDLLVSAAQFSDTGHFTCSYIINDTQTSLPSSTQAHLYVYVYGRQLGVLLALSFYHVSTLTRDIDIAVRSVCLSVTFRYSISSDLEWLLT